MDDDGRRDPAPDDDPIDDDENPEWTAEDFARAKPISEIPELAFLLKRGRPAKADSERKRRVTIMLDPEVIEHFRAGGRGWQTRINAALRKAAGL